MDTVLGIYAHPDDADVDAGGTLARFAREGSRVVVAVVTEGDAGGSDQDLHQQMGELRRDEQRRACEQLGVTELVFFDGYPDGMVTLSHGLVRDIVALIRRVKPNLILTLSPEYNWSSIYANHPDHRAVGAAVTDAVYPAARNPFAFPELLDEGLDPHVVEEVWFQGVRRRTTSSSWTRQTSRPRSGRCASTSPNSTTSTGWSPGSDRAPATRGSPTATRGEKSSSAGTRAGDLPTPGVPMRLRVGLVRTRPGHSALMGGGTAPLSRRQRRPVGLCGSPGRARRARR